MTIEVRTMQPSDVNRWDAYVAGHRQTTPYHLSGWQEVIAETYGHQAYYLLAEQGREIKGLLPLVHLKHSLSGNRLISMPFLDLGGVLADDSATANRLVGAAWSLMEQVDANALELRHGDDEDIREGEVNPLVTVSRSSDTRCRMLLELPGSTERLMQTFTAKLRNQIRRPVREGLVFHSGGVEYLDDFYRVFAVNMRDLGSPVHAKNFFKNILEMFPEQARLFVVYRGEQPLAGSLALRHAGTLYNPWASALRRYRKLCPNMLLYWSMLAYATDLGLSRFDFGRSTEGTGTYRFKQQWGALPNRLHWFTMGTPDVSGGSVPAGPDKGGFQVAVQLWKRMPVPLSQLIGPVIRKHIGL